MEPNEEPFESLTRGLDRDLSSLFDTAESAAPTRILRSALDPVFGRTGLSGLLPTTRREVSEFQAFESLSDRFAQKLAVFPLANRVVVNEFGAYIPRSLFQNQTDFDYRDEEQRVEIKVSIHSTEERQTEGWKGPMAYQARSWHELPKDDPIFDIGRGPVTLEITDASENLDRYIYGGE